MMMQAQKCDQTRDLLSERGATNSTSESLLSEFSLPSPSPLMPCAVRVLQVIYDCFIDRRLLPES